jgi:hypothetical protein
MARLVCPLCGTAVVEGGEPAAAACRGCGALYAGGGESPPAAVAAALVHWGVQGLPADALALRLFEVEPAAEPGPTAAITSDQRDDFYLWWVFVRAGDAGVTPVFQALLTQ